MSHLQRLGIVVRHRGMQWLDFTNMVNRIEMGVYWGARRQSLNASADATLSFLQELAQVVPEFAELSVVLSDVGNELPLFDWTVESTRNALKDGMNRNELDGSPISDLVYTSVLLCSGCKQWDLWSIRVQCAVYHDALFNSCEVQCANIDKSPRILNREEWLSIADAQIRCWRPDGGCLITSELVSPQFIVRPVRAGWLTYLSSDMLTSEPDLPVGVSTQRILRRGTMFEAWPSSFTDRRKSDVKRVRLLASSLKRAVSGRKICE